MSNDALRAENDRLAQNLYTSMHRHGRSLTEAAAELQLTAADVDRAKDHLVRLRLLMPETGATVDAAAALARSLETNHRALDELVEQHVMTASLVKGYLGVTRDAGVPPEDWTPETLDLAGSGRSGECPVGDEELFTGVQEGRGGLVRVQAGRDDRRDRR
ncbi:hypothetical protein [Nonomuraea recticatena]|uniref:hypothetical protein n=1 Tax=Nonomuraea recticatena TaxID=46178 RepID=UPI00360600D8